MIFGNTFRSKSINKWHASWNLSFCLHSKRHNALRCPKTPQRRPPNSPRRTQNAPKTAPRRLQDASRHPQDGPNCAQLLLRPPRSPPSLDFGPSGPRFDPPGLDFGPSIHRFAILQTLSCILSNIVLSAVLEEQSRGASSMMLVPS